MKQSKLSVIIPTKDRAETLQHCLKTVVAQTNPNLEILISDNFSGPDVKAVVDSFDDPRIRYIRTPSPLGMAENYEYAIENASGDWIAIIGDDDGLLPGAVDKFFALHNKYPKIKAITCANCFYKWPVPGHKAKLEIISGKGYEVRDSREYTLKAVKGKPVSQPTIYTGGFVHMDVIERAKSLSKNRRFFQSINPDIYSGMAICALTDKYIYSWEAWSIAGISKHSTGMAHKNKTKEEVAKLDFHKTNENKFHPTLGNAAEACIGSPLIYLYEAFLQSSHLRKGDDMGITLYNQLALFISAASNRIKKDVLEYVEKIARLNGLDYKLILAAAKKKAPLYKTAKRVNKLGRKIPGLAKLKNRKLSAKGVNNIDEAAKKISAAMRAS